MFETEFRYLGWSYRRECVYLFSTWKFYGLITLNDCVNLNFVTLNQVSEYLVSVLNLSVYVCWNPGVEHCNYTEHVKDRGPDIEDNVELNTPRHTWTERPCAESSVNKYGQCLRWKLTISSQQDVFVLSNTTFFTELRKPTKWRGHWPKTVHWFYRVLTRSLSWPIRLQLPLGDKNIR